MDDRAHRPRKVSRHGEGEPAAVGDPPQIPLVHAQGLPERLDVARRAGAGVLGEIDALAMQRVPAGRDPPEIVRVTGAPQGGEGAADPALIVEHPAAIDDDVIHLRVGDQQFSVYQARRSRSSAQEEHRVITIAVGSGLDDHERDLDGPARSIVILGYGQPPARDGKQRPSRVERAGDLLPGPFTLGQGD